MNFEKRVNIVFRVVFLFLAFMALIGIIIGAYQHIVTLIMCLILQFSFAEPAKKQVS